MDMDEDELLIEYVKEHEEFYNVAHPQYLNKVLKEKKWKTIADRLGRTVAVCKSRWYNIRDNFRKALKKRSPRTKFRKYKFENQLSFLLPFMQEIETSNNSVDEVFTPKVEDSNDEDNRMEFVDCKRNSTYSDDDNSITKRIKICTPEVQAPSSNILMKHLPDASQNESVDAFLVGLAPTLKTFSPYNLNIAKSKIFNIVQEMELEQIKQRYSTDL